MAVVLLEVFKCFLCACAANDAGREATGGPPPDLDAKRLVNKNIHTKILVLHMRSL